MVRWFMLLVLAAGTGLWAGESRWGEFLGRFHLVLLHLPIGLVVGLALVDLQALRTPMPGLRPFRGTLAWANAFAALFAAGTGWLLAGDGDDYQAEALAWHRWLGVAVACSAGIGLVLHLLHQRFPATGTPMRLILTLNLLLVILAGHHGGSLTHGSGFLTHYAPTWLGGPAPTSQEPEADPPLTIPIPISDPSTVTGLLPMGEDATPMADPPMDDGPTYAQVAAIFDSRCTECHGPTKQKGRLRLDTPAAIQAGSENGPVLVIGEPERSKLYSLIVLPADHEDIMPSKGDPLTPEQIAVIKAWIAVGAPFDGAEAAHPVEPVGGPVNLATAFDALAATLAEPDPAIIAELEKAGAVIRSMSANARLKEINLSHTLRPVDDELLKSLKRIAPNVGWLDLGGTAVTSDQLTHLKPLTNLLRLHLERTRISDDALVHLIGLPRLEYLNLVGTQVTDGGLYRLSGISSLTSVYLWGSKATSKGAERLKASIPGCLVSAGP